MAQDEYVIMPADHYQAACDQIRESTGGTEVIKSGDLASQILRVAGVGELGGKEITENGAYVASSEGLRGYSHVTVNVPTTGGTELPKFTKTPATAADAKSGKQFVNEAGTLVDGAMGRVETSEVIIKAENAGIQTDSTGLKSVALSGFTNNPTTRYIEPEESVWMTLDENHAKMSVFGNASPSQVAKGATFTSAAGLVVEGEHVCEGGVELPEFDKPSATWKDVVRGKQFIDDNGELQEGDVLEVTDEYWADADDGVTAKMRNATTAVATYCMGSDTLIRSDVPMEFRFQVSDLGFEPGGDLPELTNPGSASDLAVGKELIGANGEKIVGEVPVTESTQHRYWDNPTAEYNSTNQRLELRGASSSGFLLRPGGGIRMYCAGDRLGNATPDDVVSRKTFTSENGLKITGKHVCSGGGGLTVKTGTTTNGTIDTGLSSIEYFFLYRKTAISAVGLVSLHYSATEGTSAMQCTQWSVTFGGSKTVTHSTTNATVNGGSITIPGSSASSGGLASNVTYYWTAVGNA